MKEKGISKKETFKKNPTIGQLGTMNDPVFLLYFSHLFSLTHSPYVYI